MALKIKREGAERFQGLGIDFKAKMIGIEKVDEARGDRMCQEAMGKLKAMVKAAGEHKQRIIISISIEGLKIMDEKTGSINHHHEVHKISFISRDPSDNRAFGYIYGEANNHQFFGIKTEKASEHVVLALKDLFQVVLELKTKQMEEQKMYPEQPTVLHLQSSYDDPLYEVPFGQKPATVQEDTVTPSQAEETSQSPEDVNALYAVPHKSQSEQSGSNLLDLAAEVKTLQLGINDMDQFSFDPVAEGSTNQNKTPDSLNSKSPNPFQMSNSWSTDPFNSPEPTQSQQPPATNFAAAFGDPFVAPTTTSQESSSANLFAEFSDTFNPSATTTAPSNTANPFGNNFSSSNFGATNTNEFGAPSPFSTPANAAFGSSVIGAPSTGNVFQTNFSAASQAPAMQKPADPFGDPFSFGGPTSAVSSEGVIGQPLAPTAVPTSKDSNTKPDPFGDLNLINSSSSKSGKDMFANFQMAKPGEVAMPDIMPTGIPDRPPPAVPMADGNLNLDSPNIDLQANDEQDDFNLPPPQVPPPTLPPTFNALDSAPPPPPPRPRYTVSSTISVEMPPRPARPDSIENLNSNNVDKSNVSPTRDFISKQQFSLPCAWTSDSLDKHFDNKNLEETSNSERNLATSNVPVDQEIFDPFNLHSNDGSSSAWTIPSHCISNHPSSSHPSSFTDHFTLPLSNGTANLSSSLPTNERIHVKMSSSKSTSSISSLKSKAASLPIHDDPFADDPFATDSAPTNNASSLSFCASSHSTSVVPPPLPSRPKSHESINNGKNPVSGATTKKSGLTTSDGLVLFDDSPFGI